jgi:hypothetical protein
MSASAGGKQESLARVELFEALSHPVRVRILESLESGGLKFSDLKRATGISSNGHLEFHLGKLSGLVSTTEGGNYSLTDDGREALRFLRISGAHDDSERAGSRSSGYRKAAIAALIIGLLVSGSVLVMVGFLLPGQTSWQWDGSAGTGIATTTRTVSPGGALDMGLVQTDPSTSTYRAIATWMASGQLVFTVLAIPPHVNLSQYIPSSSSANWNGSGMLTQNDGPGNFAYLQYKLPSGDYRIDYILVNPSQSNVTLTGWGWTTESQYSPDAQTASNLAYLGAVLLGVAGMSIVAIYLVPYLGRKPK